MTSAGLLALLLACAGDGEEPDTGELGPDPWAGLEATPLDPFREIASLTLSGAEAPSRLRTLPERSLGFALDAGSALVLDARYHHDPAGSCVDASLWPGWLDEEARADCAEGEAWTRRGKLSPPSPAVDLAVDRAGLRVGLLTRQGGLALASADVLGANPLHWLRLAEPVELETGALSGEARLALSATLALVGDGEALWALDPASGAALDRWTLDAPILALHLREEQPWALTEAGLWVGGTLLEEATGAALAEGPDAVWVGGEGALVRVDPATLAVQRHAVEGALGPLAVDELGRVWAATADGVALLEDGAELARYEGEAPVDLAMNSAGELVLLYAGGRVSVRVDDTTLAGDAPLDVLITAFVERPRGAEDQVPCEGDEESVREFASRAARNAPVLRDQPLPVALGLTPTFARRASTCELADTVAPLLALDRQEAGVLFHDLPDGCAEQSCLPTFLASEVEEVRLLAPAPSWASGLAPMDELGVDWVRALEAAEGPDRVLFFGMSVLPELAHEGDPRAKDAWPVAAGTRAPAWRVSSLDTLAEGDPAGWLTLYPGDNIPAFNLGDCPNLLLAECHLLGRGGAPVIAEEDVATLHLLLRRALAERSGPSTWTFHLPDLGVYEYSEGCDVQDRIWSGEDCQAAAIQAFALEVHQRYALHDLVRLRLPSELETP